MATHSSVLAWRIPGTGKPGGLPFLGSHRVGHDRSDLAAAATIQVQGLSKYLFSFLEWPLFLFSLIFQHKYLFCEVFTIHFPRQRSPLCTSLFVDMHMQLIHCTVISQAIQMVRFFRNRLSLFSARKVRFKIRH